MATNYDQIARDYQAAESIFKAVHARQAKDNGVARDGYVEPANERERSIAAVWGRVLGIDQVGVEHSFKELGGDSLKSVMLVAQLKRELDIDLSITDFFEYPTVRAITRMLDAQTQGTATEEQNRAGSAVYSHEFDVTSQHLPPPPVAKITALALITMNWPVSRK